jgi:hypothetical protein
VGVSLACSRACRGQSIPMLPNFRSGRPWKTRARYARGALCTTGANCLVENATAISISITRISPRTHRNMDMRPDSCQAISLGSLMENEISSPSVKS